GTAGLLFIDAHEDATTMDSSPDGEAANMEIALLLGLTGHEAPVSMRRRLPAVDLDRIVMLGQRDEGYRKAMPCGTLRRADRASRSCRGRPRVGDVASTRAPRDR